MKDKIETFLKRKYPNATKELITRMTQIYVYVSEENQKTKENKLLKMLCKQTE